MNKDFVAESADYEMKMNILHAVDRDLDLMTVGEICKRSGISRQTFYRHFETKYDIILWHALLCERLYLDEIGRSLSWREGYYHHFRLLSEERHFYEVSLQFSVHMAPNENMMPRHRREVILETLRDYRHIELTETLRFALDAFVEMESHLANKWFRSGLHPEPAVFAELMESVVPPELHAALSI